MTTDPTGAAALAPKAPVAREPRSTRALLARLVAGSLRPYRLALSGAAACMAVAAAAQPLLAWLMEPVVSEIFIERDRTMLYLVPAGVIAVMLFGGLANFGQAVLMNWVGLRVVADLQARVTAHLVGLDLAFFQRTPTGRLIATLTSDAQLVRHAASTALTGLIKDALSVVLLVALMFYQNWELALVVFFVFPLAALPISRLGRRMRKVVDRTQGEIGAFAALLTETFQGVRQVKAYGMEGHEVARARRLIDRLFRLYMKSARTRATTAPVMEALGGLAIAAVIFYGGREVVAGEAEAGAFFAFVTALLLAYRPLKSVANLNTVLQEGLAAAERVFALLDLRPEVVDRPGAAPLRVRGGGIALDGVRFAYTGAAPALDRLDLEVPAGKSVALVGPSGAGKSTILNLIPRFYDVDAGAVRIDGQDVRAVTLASLRGAIALVSQDVVLFDDTVRANIAYGRPGAGEAAIEAAARAAGAHDFILGLPRGYETAVGERGVTLSGGQRQRIAIARAMLKDAPILLLDEATAALDSESEVKVQEALGALKRGRTTLVIAHRLSTVREADLIYAIDGGRVIEKGTHAELLAAGGLYARLYALQFAGARARTLVESPPAVRAVAGGRA